MGGSEARCLKVKMVSESVNVSCNTGQVSEITQFGVYQNESEADQRGLCTADNYLIDTGMDCSSLSKHDTPFYQNKLDPCVG